MRIELALVWANDKDSAAGDSAHGAVAHHSGLTHGAGFPEEHITGGQAFAGEVGVRAAGIQPSGATVGLAAVNITDA